MTEQLTIAVVGTGSRAQDHLSTIQALRDHFNLVGIADANETRRTDVGQRYGVPAFADATALFDDTTPDAVLIVVPPDGHHVLTTAAAERGVHIACEVPVATTLPMADVMITTAEQHNVKLAITENVWRWPTEQLKRQVVRKGLIGDITQIHLWYTSGSYHGISAVRAVLTTEPVRVLGVAHDVTTPERPDLMGAPRNSHPWELGVIEFADGATCVYQQPIHRARGNSWEIVGTDGYIDDALVREARGQIHRHPIQRITEERNGRETLAALMIDGIDGSSPVEWENPYRDYGFSANDEIARADILTDLHRAIVTGTQPGYNGRDARGDQEILLALRESVRQGCTWIDLPLTHTTGFEDAIHSEYVARYGQHPLTANAAQAAPAYPRLGVNQHSPSQ